MGEALRLLRNVEKHIGRDYCGHNSDSCPKHKHAEYTAKEPCLRCRLDAFFDKLPDVQGV